MLKKQDEKGLKAELWHKSPDSNICWLEYLKQIIFSNLEFIKFDLDLICMLCWFDLDLICKPADLICDLKERSKSVAGIFLILKPREWTNYHDDTL